MAETESNGPGGSGGVLETGMREASFTVAYDGKAVANHEIDVRDLAPALLAIGDFFEAANKQANDDRAKVRVLVRAHEPGSFEVDLNVVQSFFQTVQTALAGPTTTAAANLLALLGSLIALVRWIAGRKVDAAVPNGDEVMLTIGDTVFVVSREVLNLYEDARIRRALEGMTRPLETEGIEIMQLKSSTDEVLQEVRESERAYFIEPLHVPVQEILLDETHRKVLKIAALDFTDDNKWRVSDGQAEVWVAMRDEDFARRVRDGEQFANGDVLICRVRTIQSRMGTKLTTQYEVIRVEEHKKVTRPHQLDWLKK